MLSEEHAEAFCVDCGYRHDLDRPCPEPASRRPPAQLSLAEERPADQRLLPA